MLWSINIPTFDRIHVDVLNLLLHHFISLNHLWVASFLLQLIVLINLVSLTKERQFV